MQLMKICNDPMMTSFDEIRPHGKFTKLNGLLILNLWVYSVKDCHHLVNT